MSSVARYEFKHLDTSSTITMRGTDAMAGALPVAIADQPGVAVVKYQRRDADIPYDLHLRDWHFRDPPMYADK